MSDRQKLFYALLASAFFHLALGLVLAFWTAQHSSEVEKALPDLSQLVVTIMPPRPAEPSSAAKAPPVIAAVPTPPPAHMMRPVLDSDGLKSSSKAPANPVFQSDSNMVAGSRLPASGDIPLPSMSGPSRKFMDFADQAASMGKGQTAAIANPHSAQPASAMPEQSPFAVTRVQRAPAPAPQSTPAPTAAPVAQSTPNPTKPLPTPSRDTLAVGKPTPTPPPPAQLPTPVEQLARLTIPPPLHVNPGIPAPPSPQTQPASQRSAQPPTQRETERTHIDGGITTPGAPGVDAVETPFGRYHRKLSNLIGSRWKLYLEEHPKDIGDVTIHVKLNTGGKVVATRVVANHSLDDLADLSIRAIRESDLPPVPDDLAPMLRDGKLEIDFNFNVYDPSNNDSPGR
jgi:hypothetical protein